MSAVKRAKSADLRWKHIVFGFIRRHSVAESISVPVLVQYICLNFYLLDERFRRTDCANCNNETSKSLLTLSADGRLVTNHNTNNHRTALWSDQIVAGSIMISTEPEGISEYEWKITVTGGDVAQIARSPLSIGLGSLEGDVKSIAFYDGKMQKIYDQNDMTEPDFLGDCSLEKTVQMTMSLHVEDRSLHISIRRSDSILWSGIIGDVPLEKVVFLIGIVGKGHEIRLNDFSVQQNSK